MGKYNRKSDRQLKFTAEILKEARDRVQNGESKRGVAKSLGINECTLRKRLRQGTVPVNLGRYKPVFTLKQEAELANHIKDLDGRFYGLRVKEVRSLAYQYADMNKIPHRFDRNSKLAGKHWVQMFAARNNLSLRAPEKCSLARASGFNQVQCRRFFENLKLVYEQTNALPHRVFNMDETGLSTVPNKLPKVFASKGKRTVCKIVSGERGQLVTAVCCMSASGGWVPPGLIFARKRMKEELFYGAPPGTLKMISDTGYMNSELFLKWLRHFSEFAKPSKADPVILTLDNHISHCSLEAIIFAREHSIVLLTLPPHASHKMQPLDRGFFFPLKTAFSSECDKWMVTNQGRPITMKEMSALFHAAYSKVATIQICEKSFGCTGLYPYNPDVFTSADFAPAEVTNKPEFETERSKDIGTHEDHDSDFSEDDYLPLCRFVTKHDRNKTEEQETLNLSGIVQVRDFNSPQTPPPVESSPGPSTKSMDLNVPARLCQPVTPKMILPLPKASHIQIRKKKSKKSEILSSTPYKNKLLEKRDGKEKLKSGGKRHVFGSKSEYPTNENQKLVAESDNTVCLGCSENFSTSDWIRCSNCGEWWHEECSNYIGTGNFVCDCCDNN